MTFMNFDVIEIKIMPIVLGLLSDCTSVPSLSLSLEKHEKSCVSGRWNRWEKLKRNNVKDFLSIKTYWNTAIASTNTH